MRSCSILAIAVLALAWASFAKAQNPQEGKLPAPEFAGVTEWLNSKPLKLSDLRGKVVLVHFWAFGCSNCIHDHDKYLKWHDRFKDRQDFVMIGVHTPETQPERDLANVRAKVQEVGFRHAIAIDNESKIWAAWRNRWWPSMYLIDRAGNVRYAWEGELTWNKQQGPRIMSDKIEALLKEDTPLAD